MQPDTANGWMLFADRLPAEVTEQAAAFPTADHDDALDAIERAWTKLGGTPIRMETTPLVGGAR
jgi:phage terminase large subunit-like protein